MRRVGLRVLMVPVGVGLPIVYASVAYLGYRLQLDAAELPDSAPDIQFRSG